MLRVSRFVTCALYTGFQNPSSLAACWFFNLVILLPSRMFFFCALYETDLFPVKLMTAAFPLIFQIIPLGLSHCQFAHLLLSILFSFDASFLYFQHNEMMEYSGCVPTAGWQLRNSGCRMHHQQQRLRYGGIRLQHHLAHECADFAIPPTGLSPRLMQFFNGGASCSMTKADARVSYVGKVAAGGNTLQAICPFVMSFSTCWQIRNVLLVYFHVAKLAKASNLSCIVSAKRIDGRIYIRVSNFSVIRMASIAVNECLWAW